MKKDRMDLDDLIKQKFDPGIWRGYRDPQFFLFYKLIEIVQEQSDKIDELEKKLNCIL